MMGVSGERSHTLRLLVIQRLIFGERPVEGLLGKTMEASHGRAENCAGASQIPLPKDRGSQRIFPLAGP